MKWDEMRESDNVEDQRDGSDDESSTPNNLSSSSSMGMLGGLGAGGMAIAVIVGLIFKVDPSQILNLIGGNNKPAPCTTSPSQKANPRSRLGICEICSW